MSQTVDLPEKVWSALQQAALASGITPAVWIAAHLSEPANVKGITVPVEEECADDLDPPTYTSVPLERVSSVHVVCVAGKAVPPLPYPLEDLSE